jgi:hypothetical protein
MMRRWRRKFKNWWLDRSALSREMLVAGAVIGVLAGGGLAAWVIHKGPYRNWQQVKAVERGREAVEKGDYVTALLAFRRATQLRPDKVETWREVAEFLSKVGSPEVLVARENLVRLAPEEMSYRMALVSESLKQGDMVLATRAMTELERKAVEDASFYRLAAALALALGKEAELEAHLGALVKLEPENAAARFNLAALRLWGADREVAAQAEETIYELMGDEEWRVRGALEVLKRAAATMDKPTVDRVVARVLRQLNPVGAEVALARPEPGEPPGWSGLMEALRVAAARRAPDAAALAEWWSKLGARPAVITWIDGLEPAVGETAPVRSVLTGLVAAEGMTERLDALLAAGAWGPIKREAINLALAARWQAGRPDGRRAETTWADAVQATDGNAASLRVLVRLGAVWQRPRWQVEALWPIVTQHRGEYWALEVLRTSLVLRRDEAGLLRLYEIWATRTLDSVQVQSTRVMLAALMDRMNSSAEQSWRRLEERPVEAPVARLALVAAYWRMRDTAKAQALLEGFPPDEGMTRDAKVNLWRGLVAAQADAREEARAWLVPLDDRSWLPSERKLRGDALEDLRQRDRQDAEAARKAEQERLAEEAKKAQETQAADNAEPVTP